MSAHATAGIDRQRVDQWLAAQLQLPLRLTWQRIGAGRSNLTYLVSSPQRQVVLRRPPLGDFPPTAHDVVREARFLTALACAVPVPQVLAVCTDESVTGAPFIVMEYLPGHTIATFDDAAALNSAQRAAAGPAVVDALIALHQADPALVGFPHLMDRRDFIARQLKRWLGNWRTIAIRDLPEIAEAHDVLLAAMPQQSRITVVHGDFRLDNCRLTSEADVAGILDWELATIGDPAADLGQLLTYWAEPDDEITALADPPTRVPGFATRAELADRYRAACGDVAIDFYLAFNWWKTACILEDVYSRVARGAMGETDRSADSFAQQARRVARHALACARQLPAQ